MSFQPASQRAPRRGFTLIELLIVVAIIAILAAIAVPNFLEAQTRAKVSRAKADMRTLATALEAYFTDHNSYTNDSDGQFETGYNGFARLTTPVAFITSLAQDPFQTQIKANQAASGDFKPAIHYQLGSGSDQDGWNGYYAGLTPRPSKLKSDGTFGNPRVHSYEIISQGPDYLDDTSDSHYWPWGASPGLSGTPARLRQYDPTNGTTSRGDIYRLGGALGHGNYTVDGQRYGTVH
jgi:type II secretion system protein G